MYHYELDVSQLKRESSFPYPLCKVFYSKRLCLPSMLPVPKNFFEVCLRLDSKAEWCNDIVNEEPIHVPYPHAVWKMPTKYTVPRDNCARDVLAFVYSPEKLDDFRRAGLVPDVSCLPFSMNAEISFLVEKFMRLVNNLYSPGVADQLDWLGFSLIKEVLLAAMNPSVRQTMEQRMKNIAVWLDAHCAENPDFHAIARQHHLNYTQFYREWSRYNALTPFQYVIRARLANAAKLLKITEMPVSKIIETVNFSGHYAFYRKFEQEYGMTPAEYRRRSQTKLEQGEPG